MTREGGNELAEKDGRRGDGFAEREGVKQMLKLQRRARDARGLRRWMPVPRATLLVPGRLAARCKRP